jgi:hypothetical protein
MDDPLQQRKGFGFYASWFFGLWYLLGAVYDAFTLAGLVQLVIALTLLPPVGRWLLAKFKFTLTRRLKAITIIGCLLLLSVLGVSGQDSQSGEQQSDQRWWEHFYADYYAPR